MENKETQPTQQTLPLAPELTPEQLKLCLIEYMRWGHIGTGMVLQALGNMENLRTIAVRQNMLGSFGPLDFHTFYQCLSDLQGPVVNVMREFPMDQEPSKELPRAVKDPIENPLNFVHRYGNGYKQWVKTLTAKVKEVGLRDAGNVLLLSEVYELKLLNAELQHTAQQLDDLLEKVDDARDKTALNDDGTSE